MPNKNITEIIHYLTKDPFIFALAISIVLICCATKFANATVSSQILFGVIGVSTLIFSAWVIKQFITNGIGR